MMTRKKDPKNSTSAKKKSTSTAKSTSVSKNQTAKNSKVYICIYIIIAGECTIASI